ncbi:hypothetical protein [Streptomyces sp. NBC_00078]|uniref:hypothetical protein n=1 Tax=unclassified Streptomyces TaxID=2593676 RepID=UPI0022530720|nr:hypothetical protein [Streptomyces sp. NBC_00078]MCX5422621.1 hypothetical protein [Streptomyces sp. NBC_00078]
MAGVSSDPDFLHSDRRRLLFVRFEQLLLFWRLDLSVRAQSVADDVDYDEAKPAAQAREGEWSRPASALASAVGAVKAAARHRAGDAGGLVDRGFARISEADAAPEHGPMTSSASRGPQPVANRFWDDFLAAVVPGGTGCGALVAGQAHGARGERRYPDRWRSPAGDSHLLFGNPTRRGGEGRPVTFSGNERFNDTIAYPKPDHFSCTFWRGWREDKLFTLRSQG